MYADKTDIFNKYVLEACSLSDKIDKLTSKHSPQTPKTTQIKKQWLPIDSTDSKSEDENEDDDKQKTCPILHKKS